MNADVAQAWAAALHNIPAAIAMRAAIRAQERETRYINPAIVREHCRYVRNDIERDVRSAKARGLIHESWSPNDLLPSEIEIALREAQLAEWEAGNDRAEQIAPMAGRPAIDSGIRLRRIQ